MHRIAAPAVALSIAARRYSEARQNLDGSAASPWPAAGEAPVYPSARSAFPRARPAFRKSHVEWRLHHGNGPRLGVYGPSRDVADFEFADGTPAPANLRRFAYKHHQDHLLVQLIRAGAQVERHAAEGLLPRVPGTAEQRAWDPEIPLFLEDLDERGAPPAPRPRDMTSRVMDERLRAGARAPNHVANVHQGETLEPNTMFATYDPKAFVADDVKAEKKRPYWSRRRWALNDNFMVPVSPKPKNTIKDE
ncbi:hypothetical protein STCU_05479 [Strigomonas culicis]|uniref:Uncharacterized protein n=1 Tax=Strigomonas culicis TaxID=28005 RepID=S9UGI0_9TRYP|nr:hypothetical protein STCU_05479 [Strigomonas culicis]|eukprot:EPY27859.1 hypothetical protein STCU_05479 [Strigomonas culicis]